MLGEPGSRNGAVPSNSYPPSPISFFDAVEMQSRDEDDDSDEEDQQPEPAHEPEEDTVVNTIDNRHSESGVAKYGSGSQSKASGNSLRMLLGNRSSPQLATPSLLKDGNTAKGYDGFDRRVPFTNVPPLPPQSSRGNFLFGKLGKARDTNASSSRITESVFDRLRHRSPVAEERRPRSSSAKAIPRPRTSLGGRSLQSWRDEQNIQDQQSRRLDGMLIEHMERERDILRKITTTLSKP